MIGMVVWLGCHIALAVAWWIVVDSVTHHFMADIAAPSRWRIVSVRARFRRAKRGTTA